MIFTLGKSRALNERPLESETIERWKNNSFGQNSEYESVRIVRSDSSERARVIDLSLTEEAESSSEEQLSWELGTPAQKAAPVAQEIQPRVAPPAAEPRLRKTSPGDLALSFEEDLKLRFGANLRSALGPGTVIEGKFSFDSPVRIDGNLTGEISSTSALIVGHQAVVNARIRVGTIIIAGRVTGEIEAIDLVEIRTGGRYQGPITTERLVIEDGGYFDGSCNI